MATPKKVTELTESTNPQLTHYIPVHDGTGLKKVLLSYIKALMGSAAATWGSITGTLSNQTDLQNALNAKQASLGFTPEDSANKKLSLTDNSDTYYPTQKAVKTAVDAKQDTLVSGTNIKTINNTSLLGSGDISIAGASSIDIGTTPITGGASGQVLYESATGKVTESANLIYSGGTFKVTGTTNQFRVAYDGTTYSNYKIDASGNMEIKNQGGATSSGNSFSVIGDNIYNTFVVGRYNNQGQFLTIGQSAIDTPMQIKTNYWSTDVPVTIGTYTTPNAIKIYVNGRINLGAIPTSSAGLVAGDLWNDSGTLKIV